MSEVKRGRKPLYDTGGKGAPVLRVRMDPDLLAAVHARGGSEWVREVLALAIAAESPLTNLAYEIRRMADTGNEARLPEVEARLRVLETQKAAAPR
jgi:hypothetical protein